MATDKELKISKLRNLRKYLDSEKYRSLRPSKAFIEWYLEAKFGKISTREKYILDDKGEAGIDAIIYVDNNALVFQMKYEERPRLSNVKRDEIAGFRVAKLYFQADALEKQLNVALLKRVQ